MRYCLKHRIDHDVIEGCPDCNLIHKVTWAEVETAFEDEIQSERDFGAEVERDYIYEDENDRNTAFVEELLHVIGEYRVDKGI